jgi:hypothetical protein
MEEAIMRPGGTSMLLAVSALIALSGCTRTPEERALATIARLGGEVEFADPDNSQSPAAVDLSRTQVTDDDLAALAGLRVQSLNLSRTKITAVGIAHVSMLPELDKLTLNLTELRGPELAELAVAKSLRNLYLIGTPLTDDDTKVLGNLDQLTTLVLWRTRLTPAGIKRLRRELPRTKVLHEHTP